MSECSNWLVWAWKSTEHREAKSLPSDSWLEENLQVSSKYILCIPVVWKDKSLMQLLKFSFEFERYRSVLSSTGQGFKPANDFWGTESYTSMAEIRPRSLMLLASQWRIEKKYWEEEKLSAFENRISTPCCIWKCAFAVVKMSCYHYGWSHWIGQPV